MKNTPIQKSNPKNAPPRNYSEKKPRPIQEKKAKPHTHNHPTPKTKHTYHSNDPRPENPAHHQLITKKEQETTMPTIREATTHDTEHITQMRHQLQTHAETSNPNIWRLTQEGRQRIRQEIAEMLKDEAGTTLIAEDSGRPIGFIHGRTTHRTHLTPGAVGFIGVIYVEEPHRRRGTGTALVRELAKKFRAQGAEEVNLRYIIGNREATRFWTSLGLTPIITIANTPLEELEKRAQKPP